MQMTSKIHGKLTVGNFVGDVVGCENDKSVENGKTERDYLYRIDDRQKTLS